MRVYVVEYVSDGAPDDIYTEVMGVFSSHELAGRVAGLLARESKYSHNRDDYVIHKFELDGGKLEE